MASLTVMLCDDHDTFRLGTSAIIAGADDIEIIGQAGCGAELIELCATELPDVVLLDISMPNMSGVDACRSVSALDDAPAIVMLTASHNAGDVTAAIDAGAIGYIVKDDSAELILAAVREAALGRSVLSVAAATALVQARLTADSAPNRNRLSLRECEVLTLIAEGCSNRDVARALIISENTVKNHVRNILEKLSVRSRVEAVLVGIREELINPEPATLHARSPHRVGA